jgi:glycine cleavage system transcriptional repressor
VLVAEVDLPPGAAEQTRARLAEVAGELDVEVTLRRVESDVL